MKALTTALLSSCILLMGASAMAQVHSGLDAQRVARLLGLLD